MLNLAPVALFVYNRPDHTKKTVEALKSNTLSADTDLLIFSDAAKTATQQTMVDAVRAFVRNIEGFKSITVVERESNMGLAASIIDGVTTIVKAHGKVIVLEDDMVTSPYFLQYMNDGLVKYAETKEVASIHAYVYPIPGLPQTFFLRGADCWGWATWYDAWQEFEPDGAKLLKELKLRQLERDFDFNGTYPYKNMLKMFVDGQNSSWAIRWYASAFLKDKLTLYPGKSFVVNIGNDNSGTHCIDTGIFTSNINQEYSGIDDIPVRENEDARRKFVYFFREIKLGFFARLILKLKRVSLKLML